jgi:peptidoglycan/xylan/chitin deacetylase (PgdA/CDA1 family)
MPFLKHQSILLGSLFVLLTGCGGKTEKKDNVVSVPPKETIVKPVQDTARNFKGESVPVLCYHAIREVQKGDSGDQKAYSVSPENFALQMKTLSENGYTTITPDQLKDYYAGHQPLPEKPIMITFDDGRKEQYTIGAETMDKYGFKGVFFIMTVSLGRNHYMSRDDVKALSAKGHIIGCHTWDHHKVTSYKGEDWTLQLSKPKKQLEDLTQKPVTAFAYPYGVWDPIAADSLKSHGFNTAFLFGGKKDAIRPLYTIQRINGPNIGKMETFLKRIDKSGA